MSLRVFLDKTAFKWLDRVKQVVFAKVGEPLSILGDLNSIKGRIGEDSLSMLDSLSRHGSLFLQLGWNLDH